MLKMIKPLKHTCLDCWAYNCRMRNKDINWYTDCFVPRNPFTIYVNVEFHEGCFKYYSLPKFEKLGRTREAMLMRMAGFKTKKEFHDYVFPFLEENADGSKSRVFKVIK